ncbi:hypothetical protein Poly59_19650 [Rubripirellula reticaptiva]|uniref:Biopterin-dependent aromatic amino acid hydroxylase family profile domain-containing protein n=1 Tax=Rubripirellula reticaptiva TaxID=2528013 RepID=A0A5C6F3E7_9BACT|nr:hypothetical protein Poly59_19650 [Rubripirellula reticaptiva]
MQAPDFGRITVPQELLVYGHGMKTTESTRRHANDEL